MKNYKFFGAKIAKSPFFQFFHNKSLLFCFKYEWRFSWGFFWGILHFCKSNIGDSRIFASIFFSFWPQSLLKPPETKLCASVTLLRSQILAEYVSFYMEYCLLIWDKNWSIYGPLSLSGHWAPKSPHCLGLILFSLIIVGWTCKRPYGIFQFMEEGY